MELHEYLIRSSYQIVVSTDSELKVPNAFGTGFVIKHNESYFFITALHNVNTELNHFHNNSIGIFTNSVNKANAEIYRLGEYYTFETFDLNSNNLIGEVLDVVIYPLNLMDIQQKFYTQEVIFNEVIICDGKLEKIYINTLSICDPDMNDEFFIFGTVKLKFNEIYLDPENTIKEFKFKNINKDGSLLFYNNEEIMDSNDWKGLSGSPIINQDGKCVGMLLSVLERSKSIFAFPIKSIVPYLDILINRAKSTPCIFSATFLSPVKLDRWRKRIATIPFWLKPFP